MSLVYHRPSCALYQKPVVTDKGEVPNTERSEPGVAPNQFEIWGEKTIALGAWKFAEGSTRQGQAVRRVTLSHVVDVV